VPDQVTGTHRRLLIVVAVLAVAAVGGIVWLWPDGELAEPPDDLEDLILGEISAFQEYEGEPSEFDEDLSPFGGSLRRADVDVEVQEGPDEGMVVTLEDLPLDGYPDLAVGDRVLLDRAGTPDGETQYFITDFQRTPTLWLLLGLFVLAVVAIGRWHGLRSLLGLAISLLIVVLFIVPAILAGESPPLVALVGSIAVMIVTLYLAHGVNEMTTAAIVGTSGALVITVGLGLWFISRSKITGYASDDALFASFAVQGLDLQGLVLAGLIIAALGVLDDVTVSQASTVFALHDTDRTLSWSSLFARAMKVGRDHIASVVNTLFLAYAGASLALLVLFSTGGVGTGEIINSEVIAEEIVKIIVGSLGLIAAVPLTTALAAKVAVDRPADAPPMGGHGHTHAPIAPSGGSGSAGATSVVRPDGSSSFGDPDPTSPDDPSGGRHRPEASHRSGSDTAVSDPDSPPGMPERETPPDRITLGMESFERRLERGEFDESHGEGDDATPRSDRPGDARPDGDNPREGRGPEGPS
jgi:uncharacterized membrane protein